MVGEGRLAKQRQPRRDRLGPLAGVIQQSPSLLQEPHAVGDGPSAGADRQLSFEHDVFSAVIDVGPFAAGHSDTPSVLPNLDTGAFVGTCISQASALSPKLARRCRHRSHRGLRFAGLRS